MTVSRKGCPRCTQEVNHAATQCSSCGLIFDASHPLRDLGPAPVKGVQLTGPNGMKLRITSDSSVLRRSVCIGMFGPEAACLSENGQCEFVRKDEFTWTVKALPGTVNATFINNAVLVDETALENGFELAVGNASTGNKGIVIKVHLMV
jgi:hypothetical protein